VIARERDEDRRQRADRLAAVLVHQDDRARAQAREHVALDASVIGAERIAAVNAPQHLKHPECSHLAIDCRRTALIRRPEQNHGLAARPLDQCLGTGDLLHHRGVRQRRQEWVRHRVIAERGNRLLEPR